MRLPRRKVMQRMVLEHFDVMKKNVKEYMSKISSKVSFTNDGWSSSHTMKSYNGTRAHFIDENWELQSVTLELVPSESRHSGKAILQYF